MKAVFADRFYWVALTNPADARYQDASAVNDILGGATVFTIDEVLAEFLTFFADNAWLPTVRLRLFWSFSKNRMCASLRGAANRFSPDLARAIGLLARPADYRWSSANAGSKAVVAGLKARST